MVLIASPDAVEYTKYTPMSRSAWDAGSLMNDSESACRACAQHAAQPSEARLTSTRAAIARLNLRKFAGLSKPANPGLSVKGKGVEPAAARSVLASSSIVV